MLATTHNADEDLDQERLLKPELDPSADVEDSENSQGAPFYKPELDGVQRSLGGTHIQM